MAPKRKQKMKNPSSTAAKATSSTSGSRLQISAANENRLRRLLLNSDVAVPSTMNSHTNSSKEKRSKNLSNIYERLSLEGFADDQIESALNALRDTASFEAALDWLCFNLPGNELPLKFSSGTSECMSNGTVEILSIGHGREHILSDRAPMVEKDVHQFSIRKKENRSEEHLDSCDPSQAEWVRMYMLQQEEEDSESWETDLCEESTSGKNAVVRTFEVIVEEYNVARQEATRAKELKDKKSQELASERIRHLKQELNKLGFSHEAIVRELDDTYQNKCNIGVHDTLMSSQDFQTHCSTEPSNEIIIDNDSSGLSCVVNESKTCDVKIEDAVGDELDSLDLGDLFVNDGISNDEPFKSKNLNSEENLQLLSGIWKKGDPLKFPKALLQQMCLKVGWEPPKYSKLNNKDNLFSYSVSILRNSTGRGKKKKTGGLVTIKLPDDQNFELFETAQNATATFALHQLFPRLPINLVLVEPYASHARSWEQEYATKSVEDDVKNRRVDFVNKLLDANNHSSSAVSNVESKSPETSLEIKLVDNNERVLCFGSNRRKDLKSARMKAELERTMESQIYQESLLARAFLPIAGLKRNILHMLENNNVILICGETGSGKTTQVPQFILDEMILSGFGGFCNILCTQPRRIAAISVAERVSSERCEPPPGTLDSLTGYQVRLQNARNDNTKLCFCTTGILLRKLAGDKNLDGITHVIVDEVHERSILSDFLLIILKNIIEKQASEKVQPLKVVLMSATVDSNLFSKYFAGCPIINVEGRTHPVTNYYLEDVYECLNYVLPNDSPVVLGSTFVENDLIKNFKAKKKFDLSSWGDDFLQSETGINPHFKLADYSSFSEQTQKNLKILNEDVIDYDLLEDVVSYIDDKYSSGAVLIFMPGFPEINLLADKLISSYRFGGSSADWIFRLHSSIAPSDQKKIFLRPPEGVRKIIISTNIAETSVTIDDVVFVVDVGKHKETRYNPQKKLSCLTEEWISRANARQRRGRAGRVKPGICFCLYTRYRYEKIMRPYQVPEMLRMPLVELCLQIKLLSMGRVKDVLSKALDPPKENAVENALSLLYEVGALEGDELVTPLGHLLAKLPVDVLIGKMMIFGTIFGCLSPILSISAFLSHKSPFLYSNNEQHNLERAKISLLTDSFGSTNSSKFSDTRSDHIVMMMAYQKWAKVLHENGVKAAQNFCKVHYISTSVMYMIRDMRIQFGTLLADIGFFQIPNSEILGRRENLDLWLSNASEPFNRFSQHPSVLKAVLCAGLYPNIAATAEGVSASTSIKFKQFSKRDKEHPIWFDGRREIHIHSSSINASLKSPRFPFIVFLEKVETSKVFVRDSSVVSPYSILLFGGQINIQHQNGVAIIDDWLKLTAPAQTAVLFNELRKALHSFLKKLIQNPKELGNTNNEFIESVVHLLLDEETSATSQ